jgi:hypothetical protein
LTHNGKCPRYRKHISIGVLNACHYVWLLEPAGKFQGELFIAEIPRALAKIIVAILPVRHPPERCA